MKGEDNTKEKTVKKIQQLPLLRKPRWKIIDVLNIDTLNEVAQEIGKPAAQIALNWVTHRPGVSSTIIGASKMEQLKDNLAALDSELPQEARKKLHKVTLPETQYPYSFGPEMQAGGSHRPDGSAKNKRTLGPKQEPLWFLVNQCRTTLIGNDRAVTSEPPTTAGG